MEARRAADKGMVVGAWQAFWNWIDERQIDKHLVSIAIFAGTWKLTEWAIYYANLQHQKSGVEVAAIIAAVTAPYMALQAAALAFYFRARS